MTSPPLIVLLGNDDDDDDHQIRAGVGLRVYGVNTCPTCSVTFVELGMEPVALLELASFLVAAARDYDRACREWCPAGRVAEC
ncbi:MAG: hypothetical protein ACRDRH_15345 [Pseudonocardia sp.]